MVTLVGPAVAANSIASEREGRTWEAVVLTGLPPATIARGKFLAAFTAIAMYIVMLAPVGALPFLFGGVTATEVVVAFGGLFLVALLSVAFGLAISSKMASLRAAIVVTLLLAFPLTIAAFLDVRRGAELRGAPRLARRRRRPAHLAAHRLRARALRRELRSSSWWPCRSLAVALPAWFLYEVTIANLTSVDGRSLDRPQALVPGWPRRRSPSPRRAVLAASATGSDRAAGRVVGARRALAPSSLFCVFLFAGDPIGPSRRVTIHWDRARRRRRSGASSAPA